MSMFESYGWMIPQEDGTIKKVMRNTLTGETTVEIIQPRDPNMPKYPLHKYQIWIGDYHLGQGYDPPSKPEMVAEVEAPNFKVACTLLELRSSLESIERRMKADEYIDHQSCRWFYNFDTNSNSWTGKYYESEAEAWKSFPVWKRRMEDPFKR